MLEPARGQRSRHSHLTGKLPVCLTRLIYSFLLVSKAPKNIIVECFFISVTAYLILALAHYIVH